MIKSLIVLYKEFKKEEKARKAEAKRRANEASEVTAQDEGKPKEKVNSPMQNENGGEESGSESSRFSAGDTWN